MNAIGRKKHLAIVVMLSFSMLVRCWNTGFLPRHVHRGMQRGHGSSAGTFSCKNQDWRRSDNGHRSQTLSSHDAPVAETNQTSTSPPIDESLYRAQGLFSVIKPMNWTSQDVVSYIRKMLEIDARKRGLKIRGRGKRAMIKVGHGGTLDPLATGVLVIGVGSGTKKLQGFLSGSKRYRAQVELGFETTTLDMDGEVIRTAPYDHVTLRSIHQILPHFTGTIQQIPPIYSAIKKNGKKLYAEARKGKTAEDLDIPPREVHVYSLELLPPRDDIDLPNFEIDVECGGGTYIRSLIRDIAVKLDSAGTMTNLIRTKQGPFHVDDALVKDDWSVDNICSAIQEWNSKFEHEFDSN